MLRLNVAIASHFVKQYKTIKYEKKQSLTYLHRVQHYSICLGTNKALNILEIKYRVPDYVMKCS